MNSKFDFNGVDENGKEFYMEIKNVSLADYVDVPFKERVNFKNEIAEAKQDDKISLFPVPDGYLKGKTVVISERALKHITELKHIAKTSDKRAILCFVIQRTDVKQFQPSALDLVYKAAVINAYKAGVEIKTLQVEWNKKGECTFVRNDLPINMEEYQES